MAGRRLGRSLDYGEKDCGMINLPDWRGSDKGKWISKKGFFYQVGKLSKGESAWEERGVGGGERDKYYGGFQQVGEDYLFKAKDSAKLVNGFFFFWIGSWFGGERETQTGPRREKTPRARGETRKKAQEGPKRSERPSMRGGTRRRRVKIMEKKYWSRVCYRRIFFCHNFAWLACDRNERANFFALF